MSIRLLKMGLSGGLRAYIPANISIALVGTADLTIYSAGTYRYFDYLAGDTTGTWLIMGANTDFECMVSNVVGDPMSSGTVGSWLSMTTNRTWTRNPPGQAGYRYNTFDFDIRRVSDQVVVAHASGSMTADSGL